MKISRIRIENFRQFKELDIDLTYPNGHPKAGQPLDKICIIGQNGTGKTTLLELVKGFYIATFPISGDPISKYPKLGNRSKITIYRGDADNLYKMAHQRLGDEEWNHIFSTNYTLGVRYPKGIVYIPIGINSIVDINSNVNLDSVSAWENVLDRYFYGNKEAMLAFEKKTMEEAIIFKKQRADYSLHLINRLQSGEKLDILAELEKWEAENPNPLIKIAAYLDKLINRFYLKTKTTLDSVDEIASIQLESMMNGETIKLEELSSGTRQILNTARPIYHLLKEDSIVLIDEPETSLYPDLQRDIINYYTSLREDLEGKVQYFFATHSPIVAAAFDPWEIVDLEFDETGNVVRHLYYEGENHVDNYTIFPKYLRWDSILNRVFDVKEGGDKQREEAIKKIAELNSKLAYWKREGLLQNPSAEVSEAIKEYKTLMNKMDWEDSNKGGL